MAAVGGRYLNSDELLAAGIRSVGRDVRVHERASIYGLENVSLGDFSRIDDFTVIVATGPVTIGRYCSVPNFCFLGGRYGIEFHDFVTLAPGVKIFTASDDYAGHMLTGPLVPRDLTGGTSGPVRLEKHVLVGTNSVILPGCTIGEGTSIGALSFVRTDLPAWGIYAGVPVRKLGPRRQDLLALEARVKG